MNKDMNSTILKNHGKTANRLVSEIGIVGRYEENIVYDAIRNAYVPINELTK